MDLLLPVMKSWKTQWEREERSLQRVAAVARAASALCSRRVTVSSLSTDTIVRSAT